MIESSKKVRKVEYPALMLYDLCGESYVVLMSEAGVGMVVESNVAHNPVGMYRTNWSMDAAGRPFFTQYCHEIVLKNF